MPSASTRLHSSGPGNSEFIEFTIFPDGRVEEKVVGVKGEACQKVTENINKVLGNVVSSTPTEEAFEEKITIDDTLVENVNAWDGSEDSWDGASSSW